MNDIIKFWFEESTSEQHFKKDPDFDALIRERFLEAYWDIAKNGHAGYLKDAEAALAGILLLDQFSRNMFRDDAQAFAEDWRALEIAKYAVNAGFDQAFEPSKRMFLYMPYMHSESREIHAEAIRLFEALGNKNTLKFAYEHKKIIDRFGRYPHRNEVLGRESSTEELGFLKEHSGF